VLFLKITIRQLIANLPAINKRIIPQCHNCVRKCDHKRKEDRQERNAAFNDLNNHANKVPSLMKRAEEADDPTPGEEHRQGYDYP
jgi:hypothetical protein